MVEMQKKEQISRKVPAYVLVGFLGSGKTTVLSQLIEWCVERGLKPGLIINEFGDISIDGEALRQEGMPMTELSSGCVCCTIGEDMRRSLLEMATRPVPMSHNPFSFNICPAMRALSRSLCTIARCCRASLLGKTSTKSGCKNNSSVANPSMLCHSNVEEGGSTDEAANKASTPSV